MFIAVKEYLEHILKNDLERTIKLGVFIVTSVIMLAALIKFS